ncbi:MAG TPA: ABC transporter ATP-binding protein [Oligoflexus sp.]|uniref:ABC transporter ATP-binding protein n=1 Tax=Oligoflexus sp. TaxID=1971216 RepID=UPI002D7F95E9|nr:ABC transporter ATP-binding protein [Oligoflexus sp.]HET9239661.1 ABC transporter ATP-binding protein [Oligoflexus sp.]
MNPRISLRTWFKPLVLEPLSEIKSCLIQIVLSLGLLSAAQGLFLLLIGPLFKAMFDTPVDGTFTLNSLFPSAVAGWFQDLGPMTITRAELAKYLPFAIFFAAVVNGFAGFIYQHQQQVMALHLGRRYREKLFAAILQLPFQKATLKSPGEWMSVVMNDVAFLQMRLSDLLTGLVRDGIMVLASVLALYFIHWPSALILTVLAIPLMASTGRTGKRIAVFAELWQRELGRMVSAVLDLRKRFEFIRAQRGEALEKERFKQMNHGYYRMIRRSIFIRAALAPSVELMGFLMFAAILWAVTRQVQGFRLEASQLLQFFAALGIVLRPLKSVGEQLARYHETKGILKQSLQTFATVRELAETRSIQPDVTRGKDVKAWNPEQGLHIQKISVAYKEGFRLTAADLKLEPGKTVALIGPSGAGKSSLIKVLAGLLQAEDWQADQTLESVVKAATLVSQKPFLFSASIRENLLYGHPTGSSDDELLKELDFVGLSAELKAMDQTLDSPVDFIQTPLSGGQMQRLTIARAMLRPQPLLLMDEVTAAIDPLAEEAITRRVIERCHEKNLCLLFVTHRLQQLPYFDEIWFVEAGTVRKFASYNHLFQDSRIHRFIDDQHSP